MSSVFDIDDYAYDYEDYKLSQNRFYIDLTEISNQHLYNRLKYFERMLKNKPEEECYVGDSEYAEDAVEAENNHNEALAEELIEHIKELKEECRERKIET